MHTWITVLESLCFETEIKWEIHIFLVMLTVSYLLYIIFCFSIFLILLLVFNYDDICASWIVLTIHEADLESTCIDDGCLSIWQLKALGIDNILGFDWPSSPSPEALIRALEVLYSLGAIDDDAKLTSPTGFQVAEIPLVCF